jgi:ATP-dependent DNA helicase RecQ
MTVDLDSVRIGLSARTDNDYNRNWNRSLLNLMQRAGVLQIVSITVDQELPGTHWEIEIRNPKILDVQSTDAWDRIFQIRNAEQQAATAEFSAFKSVMLQPNKQCILRAVFNFIEGDTDNDVPYCGRCRWCCKTGEPPPIRGPARGLEIAWQDKIHSRSLQFPSGLVLVSPEDPEYRSGLDLLLQRLASAGIEQFLVPNEATLRTAQVLAKSPAHFGFVLGHDEWVGAASESLPRLATAVLLPLSEFRALKMIDRLRQFSMNSPELTVVAIAPPERSIGDRRLDQSISRHAPFVEATLDEMVCRETA